MEKLLFSLKPFFRYMAKIFNSHFMQKEFEQLYRALLPCLNECGACGIVKCYLCKKFDVTCSLCKFRRCVPCVKFFNTLNFFYKNLIREQWNYVCNYMTYSDCTIELKNSLKTSLSLSDLALDIVVLSFLRTKKRRL